MSLNHIVFIVMDSCRHDSFMAAATPHIDRLGAATKRYSYASWTAPSHHTFAMGMMPHASPKDVFASEVYKDEFAQWKDRTGAADIAFKEFLPDLSLPKVLRKLGYRTVAKVSMPVLNKNTLLSRDFDDYKVGVNFVAAPVPEPSTYALMLAGLGAVGLMARRRRRAA